MVFSSVTFLFFFLPLVIIGFFICPKKFRKWLLLFFSLLFYTWGEGLAIVVLLFTVGISYFSALASQKYLIHKKTILVGAIVSVLGVLGLFKYADFFLSILSDLFGLEKMPLGISLPLGISFFVFQAVSYLVDVYRDPRAIEEKFSNFLLYISFFPQLIAGPIVRHSEVSSHLNEPHSSAKNLAEGLERFIIGLAKKVLIADNVAVVADVVFALPGSDLNIGLAWAGTIAYALQIYFDFSGYSDMAIGIGKMFGFHFPENFNYPYIATSIQDFWRRWHMTLSRWIRDYLYIPLGGSRRGTVRTYLNIVIAFTLCGLWHGAAWTFVIWGAYYGVLQSIERIPIIRNFFEKLPLIIRHVYTLAVVLFGWVFFRAEDFISAKNMFLALSGVISSDLVFSSVVQPYYLVWIGIGILFSMPIHHLKKYMTNDRLVYLRYAMLSIMLILIMLQVSSQQYSPFIYFRF